MPVPPTGGGVEVVATDDIAYSFAGCGSAALDDPPKEDFL
jgi:hypothetical protein